MRAKSWALLLMLLAALTLPRFAAAHPMGNFSVNHYSKITLLDDRIAIRYLIDLAEIPTFQELQAGNISAQADDVSSIRYVEARGEELGRGLSLIIDGKLVPLHMISSSVIFPPGAGGLPTMKMGFNYVAAIPADVERSKLNLQYADGNYEGHSGWKEIVAAAPGGTLLRSSVPATDRSAELSNYPTDLLNSPPQQLEATVEAALPMAPAQTPSSRFANMQAASPAGAAVPSKSPTPAGSGAHTLHAAATCAKSSAIRGTATPSPVLPDASAPAPTELRANQQQTPRSKFTELISAQHLSLWFLLTAAIIAIGLGALHALEPGHGKTIVAAYLVGSRGTARHAFLLGMIVTASHTAGVFALGAITLYASRYIVPEQLYPWLGVLSGLTIAALGCYMLLRRLTGTASDHSHEPGSSRAHWPFAKPAAEQGSAQLENSPATKKVSLAQLFTLGITGGIIPCPAALIVLLSAFALHRIALGFFLIVAFSLGLAAVLIAFGMLMVYAGRFMSRLKVDGPLTRRWLPAASAGFIALLGMALAVQAFSGMHPGLLPFSRERLGPFLFVVGLGLVLGMRHSTDPDHVVAISTIVTKQRGMGNAALIGSMWGLGHTITVFAVGALIILFGVEIPPRLGLSMEFSVAIMLVLLGVLNLTGVIQKITTYFNPSNSRDLRKADRIKPDVSTNPRASSLAGAVGRLGVFQLCRPLAIGLVHGLAGSAAVALLVLSTIRDPVWATAYLVIFGGGTMVGMMLMTAAISLPLSLAGDRSAKLSRYFGVASGMVSLCFGGFLVYQLGFLGGLFTAHPHWTPQ
jgi:ABC-type nickel/cobalt efflux system permease component RcnA